MLFCWRQWPLDRQKEDAGDGKMLDKQTMEFKDYLPEIHGTIRGKYEYQTETSESRF